MDLVSIFLMLTLGGFGLFTLVMGGIEDHFGLVIAGITLLIGGGLVAAQADIDAGRITVNTVKADPTPTTGPGYGWSCVPVNNSAGEIVCRPVTLGAGP